MAKGGCLYWQFLFSTLSHLAMVLVLVNYFHFRISLKKLVWVFFCTTRCCFYVQIPLWFGSDNSAVMKRDMDIERRGLVTSWYVPSVPRFMNNRSSMWSHGYCLHMHI